MEAWSRILCQDKPLVERIEESRHFLKTQNILSARIVKRFKDPHLLIAHDILYKFYNLKEVPVTFGAYLQQFEDAINAARDEWNYAYYKGLMDRKHSFWRDPVMDNRWADVLKRRFFELNPDIAEIEGLLRAIIQLDRLGVKNPTIEERIYTLTNGYSAEILVRVPCVENLIENAVMMKRLQALNEGKLNLKE